MSRRARNLGAGTVTFTDGSGERIELPLSGANFTAPVSPTMAEINAGALYPGEPITIQIRDVSVTGVLRLRGELRHPARYPAALVAGCGDPECEPCARMAVEHDRRMQDGRGPQRGMVLWGTPRLRRAAQAAWFAIDSAVATSRWLASLPPHNPADHEPDPADE